MSSTHTSSYLHQAPRWPWRYTGTAEVAMTTQGAAMLIKRNHTPGSACTHQPMAQTAAYVTTWAAYEER